MMISVVYIEQDKLNCGSCENGYTLAFDFHDCVSINSCSPGITVVIVMCVIVYWILVIVIILWLMYRLESIMPALFSV